MALAPFEGEGTQAPSVAEAGRVLSVVETSQVRSVGGAGLDLFEVEADPVLFAVEEDAVGLRQWPVAWVLARW